VLLYRQKGCTTINSYVTGATIKTLREAKKLTQADLAEQIGVSDKAISKWETSKGLPDISLIQPLAKALGVSVIELMNGEQITNKNTSANLIRSKIYVCPVCGNVIHSTGNAVISCCGVTLPALEAEDADEEHLLVIENVEDEQFITINHSMTKQHYISFVAAMSADRIQMVKLYPEENAEARFQIRGMRKIFFYCNRDGLFSLNIMKGIDDKRASYDDSKERRELEEMAKKLFG
jgi:transcriptional regulator with XRE-family HTH domain